MQCVCCNAAGTHGIEMLSSLWHIFQPAKFREVVRKICAVQMMIQTANNFTSSTQLIHHFCFIRLCSIYSRIKNGIQQLFTTCFYFIFCTHSKVGTSNTSWSLTRPFSARYRIDMQSNVYTTTTIYPTSFTFSQTANNAKYAFQAGAIPPRLLRYRYLHGPVLYEPKKKLQCSRNIFQINFLCRPVTCIKYTENIKSNVAS